MSARSRALIKLHDYKYVETLQWHGLVCQKCGDKLGTMECRPGQMQTHYMGSMTGCGSLEDALKALGG